MGFLCAGLFIHLSEKTVNLAKKVLCADLS